MKPNNPPVLNDEFREAYRRYKTGTVLMYLPKKEKRRRLKKKSFPRQPEGYYNQTKDQTHIHPRRLRP